MRTILVVSVIVGCLLALPLGAGAQSSCDCEREICTPDGFKKRLVDHTVDQLSGESTWTYELCVAAADGTCSNDGSSCQDHQDCWPNRCQTGGPNAGTCSQDDTTACTADADCNDARCEGGANTCRIDKFQNLSHVDVLLPEIGTCVSETQQISIGSPCTVNCPAELSCSVSDRDPSCGIGNSKVLKCDVANDTNIDPGECVTIEVKIAGETPTLGPGAIDEVTKVATTCTTDSICGPACGCAQVVDGCLTRTAGFWGTHPAITGQFDPITVCGKTLDTTDAGTCNSVTEALCIAPGTESNKTCDKNPAYQQLVRQLAAAKLNLNATTANGGNCGQAILDTITRCELLCRKSQPVISASGCIQELDAFNNSQDTFAMTPSPFDRPGPADPTECQQSSGNGLVTGKACKSAGGSLFDCRF
jgi:hypothetical protein